MARRRVPGAAVQLAAAEALPFADDSFDVVLSQLVVNFMSDPYRGVDEMRRAARRTAAATVWDNARGMRMLRVFWDATVELDPEAPDEGRGMRWCTPGELEELWQKAGLRDVEVDEVVIAAEYESFDD
jgi:SAM-dependent methyltransferase